MALHFAPSIELEQLSDRDLLVLAVHSINELKMGYEQQNERIRDLEKWRWIMTGGLGLMTFVTTTFGVYILSKL